MTAPTPAGTPTPDWLAASFDQRLRWIETVLCEWEAENTDREREQHYRDLYRRTRAWLVADVASLESSLRALTERVAAAEQARYNSPADGASPAEPVAGDRDNSPKPSPVAWMLRTPNGGNLGFCDRLDRAPTPEFLAKHPGYVLVPLYAGSPLAGPDVIRKPSPISESCP